MSIIREPSLQSEIRVLQNPERAKGTGSTVPEMNEEKKAKLKEVSVCSAVRAMTAGAIELLTMPVDPPRSDQSDPGRNRSGTEGAEKKSRTGRFEGRLALLTPREREVLPIVAGRVPEQTGCMCSGDPRDNASNSSKPSDAKDAGRIACGLCPDACKTFVPFWCDKKAEKKATLDSGERLGEELLRHLAGQQPVPILREHCMVPHRVIHTQANEPAEP